MKRIRTTFRNNEIPGRIANLQPFLSVGTLPDGTRRWWGISSPAPDMGYLPRHFHESARSAVYTVISYGTPIGWVTESTDPADRDPYVYHVPNVGYSPTTGQHQYDVCMAWRTVRREQFLRRGSDIYWHHMDGRRIVVRVPGNAVVYGRERRLRAGGMDGSVPGTGMEAPGVPYDPHGYGYPGDDEARMSTPVGDARNRAHP